MVVAWQQISCCIKKEVTILSQSYCAELEQTIAHLMILKLKSREITADEVNYPNQTLPYRLDVDLQNALMLDI